MRLRMTASPRSRCSQIQRLHSNIARLVIQCSQCPRVITEAAPVTIVNGLLLTLGFEQRCRCTDLCLRISLTQIVRKLEMNVGHCEQLSDCWSSEQQPATYYRTAAAQARRLQTDATTPRVKQYFDKMIAHCERLGCNVEPGVVPSRSGTGRSERFMIGPRSSKLMSRSY